MKKGVSLSLTTIVVAALVLVVLIILVAVLTGQTKKFVGAIGGECPISDGSNGNIIECVPKNSCTGTGAGFRIMKDCPEEKVCCNMGKPEKI